MKKLTRMIAVFTLATAVQAKPNFSGQDFSGVYDCTGDDAKEGNYKGTVTLTLKPEQSTGNYGAYAFKLDARGFGIYPGEAAADGNHMAIHFALNEPNTKDAGTGIASFKKNVQGKYTFHKFYYEREYKGGNYGFEDCVQR